MGMRQSDFEGLEPEEWAAACRAWNAHVESLERSRWECARWLGIRLLQPYSKKSLKAEDLGRFVWELDEVGGGAPSEIGSRHRRTRGVGGDKLAGLERAERLRRMEEVRQRLGERY